MIPNQSPDSSTSGFLQPFLPEPPGQINAGQPLEDFLQQLVAGVAGLDGTLVRPRWQTEPPNLPDYNVTWAACGIVRREPIGFTSAQIRYPDGNNGQGYTEMQRHEEFDLKVSFYGPQADVVSSNFHDGMMIWQNYAPLRLVGMAFVECQEALRVPEFIREQWWDRVDKDVILRRIIRRNYPILNLLAFQGRVVLEGGYTSPFHGTQPLP